jgi:hypothetical protein
VAQGHWEVRAVDAYEAWAYRHRPNAAEKGVVVNWLAECEALGPPSDATVDDKGNWTVHVGEREMYFRRYDLPGHELAGVILVMKIS